MLGRMVLTWSQYVIGMVIVSGLPREAACQIDGIPFSLAMASNDIALTKDDTPIMVSTKNEAQATTRATEANRPFIRFCLVIFISLTLIYYNKYV